jgi:hypothetical protein
MAVDDKRLPTAQAGAGTLRMITEPLPPGAMPETEGGHAARVAAALSWLETLCGDHARLRHDDDITSGALRHNRPVE